MIKAIAIISAFAATSLAGGPSTPAPGEVPQFSGHCGHGLEKYYSIDRIFNNCGETCIEPSRYGLLRWFEPGLTKATDDTPCEEAGYTKYAGSPTHGFGPVSQTLDLYAPTPKKQHADPVIASTDFETSTVYAETIPETASVEPQTTVAESDSEAIVPPNPRR